MNNTAGRNYVSGGLVVLVGTLVVIVGSQYQVGTLDQMGPGLFPMVLGSILIAVGLLLGISTSLTDNDHDADADTRLDWRGFLCIVGAVLAFMLLAQPLGLAPAAFACVTVAALGDRSTSWTSALLLGAAVSTVGTIMFVFVLKIQLSAFAWQVS